MPHFRGGTIDHLRVTSRERVRRERKCTCLVGSSGTGSRDHGHICHLDRKVIIVYEGPGPFHLARLEVILERSKVRVSEQATEKVAGGTLLSSPVFSGPCVAVIAAGVVGHFRVGGGRGSILGAVPLAHEVTDAQHGRVVHQVAAAGFRSPLRAGSIGTQGLAKLRVKAVSGRVQV